MKRLQHDLKGRTIKIAQLRHADKCSGCGSEYVPLEERVPALDIDGSLEPWTEALVAIDQRGDKGPLIALLRSETELSTIARRHLADMLERHQLRQKRGKQATPSYDLSPIVARILLAMEDLRGGATIEQATRQCKLDSRTVESAVRGQRSDVRRALRRLREP